MLSLPPLYAADHADGSLEQMLLASAPAWHRSPPRKATAHWLVSGLPLVVAAPLLGLHVRLPGDDPVLAAALLLGTPILSLLGGVGAALTLGVRSARRC